MLNHSLVVKPSFSFHSIMSVTKTTLLFFCIALSWQGAVGRGKKSPYTPEERAEEYRKRGHTWPIPEYVPNTEGWTRLMNQRFEQVRALEDSQQKWDGWIQTLSSALTMPNFTEFGWGLTHAPEKLTQDIQKAIYDGLPTARNEQNVDVIDGPRALFIDRPDLTKRVSSDCVWNA
jgi:hypothetical protein